jgi:hypothetical protein
MRSGKSVTVKCLLNACKKDGHKTRRPSLGWSPDVTLRQPAATSNAVPVFADKSEDRRPKVFAMHHEQGLKLLL